MKGNGGHVQINSVVVGNRDRQDLVGETKVRTGVLERVLHHCKSHSLFFTYCIVNDVTRFE